MDLITLALAKKYTNNYVAGSYERQMLGKPPLHPSRYGINCKTMYFKMDAGRFNFSWNNPNGRLWIFPAGTVDYNTGEAISTSTAEQPDVIIPAGGGIVSLTSDSWEGTLNRGGTTTEYIGDLADFPVITSLLNIKNCSSITGNIADVPPVNQLNAGGCPLLTGDIADLPSTITTNLYLNGDPLITGNLENLPIITGSLYLTNTKVTGAYTNVSGKNVPSAFAVPGTQISAEDMDATLIAFAQCTKTGGSFIATGMTRTSASDEAVAYLTTPVAEGGLGWTVSGLTKL